MTLLFNKSGEFTAEFQRQFDRLTSSTEISGSLAEFGKGSLLNQLESLSSAQKYGNIYLKQGVSGSNKVTMSLVIESNEVTLSDSGIEEQLTLEFIFEITFKNNNYKTSIDSNTTDSVVAFVAVAVIALVLGAIAALGSGVGSVVTAAVAIIIWIGDTAGFIKKK